MTNFLKRLLNQDYFIQDLSVCLKRLRLHVKLILFNVLLKTINNIN